MENRYEKQVWKTGMKNRYGRFPAFLGRYGTFLPPKAGAVYKFRPEGEKKIHTALKPKAEGQYGFFSLLKVGIYIPLTTSAGGMTFYLLSFY